MLLQSELPFVALTPEDVLTDEAMELVVKRTDLWTRCEIGADREVLRAAVIKMCTEGTEDEPGYLFFIRHFAQIFESRNPPGLQRLPMVPYPYQIEELAEIHRAMQSGFGVAGLKNIILWLKSRDMGMTWLVLIYFLWDWLFNKGSFHLGSFKEEEVDKLGAINTLFGKLRFALYALPKWMLPKKLVDKTMLLSYDNDEVFISGESANPGFGRSKRCKAALLDEFQQWENDYSAFQSISNTCNTIFLVGTPLGYGNFYGEIARKKKVPGAQVRRVHWTAHPLKTKDLTIGEDGKETSSWYRNVQANFPPEVVAAEIDLSFETSQKGPIFASGYGVGNQKKGMRLIPGVPVIRSWDPGGWFGVVFLQIDRYKRVHVYKEIITEGIKLSDVADMVIEASEQLAKKSMPKSFAGNGGTEWYEWFTFEDVGDPSGAQPGKSNQLVPEYVELFESHRINVDYLQFAHMPTNIRIRARIIQIQNAMKRHISSGTPELDGPAFWIDVDECTTLDEALRGGYRYKTDSNGNVTDKIEERHPYNDVVDALGYGVVNRLGIPEQLRREAKQKTEDEREDEESDYGRQSEGRRSRC